VAQSADRQDREPLHFTRPQRASRPGNSKPTTTPFSTQCLCNNGSNPVRRVCIPSPISKIRKLALTTRKDTPGPTFLSYTPDGKKLITVGSENPIRVFTSGSDAEPINIDDCAPDNTAVAASVRVLRPRSWIKLITLRRTTSSLLDPRMERFANTLWRLIRLRIY
jgi:WD40 repeat protein